MSITRQLHSDVKKRRPFLTMFLPPVNSGVAQKKCFSLVIGMHHTEEELRRRAGITVSEYSGIVPYFEVMYIQSILYPAGRAVDAFERLA